MNASTGPGYPAGLVGDAIPHGARALSVLEAYAAMTHERPYRARLSPEEACEQLIAAAGTQFDPEIAQLLVEEIRSGPVAVDDALTDAVIEALPLNLAGQAGSGIGPLPAATTDGLTLLGNQRALYHDLRDAAGDAGRPPRSRSCSSNSRTSRASTSTSATPPVTTSSRWRRETPSGPPRASAGPRIASAVVASRSSRRWPTQTQPATCSTTS